MSVHDFASAEPCLNPDAWLHPGESRQLRRMRSPDRRVRWLGGRWLAKELLRDLTTSDLSDPRRWHIESRDGRDRPTKPMVFLDGRLQKWRLSISHSTESVYVATTEQSRLRLGVDVTELTPPNDGFARMMLTPAERLWCDTGNDPRLRCLVWCVKEALYKARDDRRPFRPLMIDCITDSCLGRIPPETVRFDGLPVVVSDDRCEIALRTRGADIAARVVLKH